MEYSPRTAIQRQQYFLQYNQSLYHYHPDYGQYPYYDYSGMQYSQQPPYYAQYQPIVETMSGMTPAPRPRPEVSKPPPVKTEGIIDVNMVVPAMVAQKVVKEVAKSNQKVELKRPEPLKEQKKEVKKVADTTKQKSAPQKPIDTPQKTKEASPKAKETKEEKKAEKNQVKEKMMEDIAPIKEKVQSDLMKFEEIIKDLKGGAFTYEVIVRIGTELKICHAKPTPALEQIINRQSEFRDPITGERKENKMQRRQKTEIEIQIDNEAKAQKKKLDESASKVDKEGELKLALNKLTPDNYSVMFKTIWELTEKLPDTAVDVIFKKAWNEQNYISLYGTLCKNIIYKQLGKGLNDKIDKKLLKSSDIRKKILYTCHLTFTKRREIRTELKDSSKKELTEEELDYLHNKKFFGSIPLL